MTTEVCVSNGHCFPPRRVTNGHPIPVGDRLLRVVLRVAFSFTFLSLSISKRGRTVRFLIIVTLFLSLLLVLLALFFSFLVAAAAPPSFMLLPPLGAGSRSVVGVLWMYPSMLRWTFGVL